jgi:N-methylhydantoinase A
MARWRVGVDVGGTFTDLAVFSAEGNHLRIFKVPTTPTDPSIGVLNGLDLIERELPGEFFAKDIDQFLHGTTITTNALIQRTFKPCAVLVTEGLRGSVQVQNQQRQGNLYDLTAGHADSLVDEVNVFEIPERVDADGSVVRVLDTAAVADIGVELHRRGIESLAVCLLFSFANPNHERQVREILAEACPSARVTLSSEVLPRIREWPRISTMLLNASLEPLLVDYVRNLADSLQSRGLDFKRLFLMESNGGLMPFSAVIAGGRAVHTLLSGPAAAVQGALSVARAAGEVDMLTLDIGGTSADIAFVNSDGAMEITEGQLVGHDIYVPMLDITTIGAGGGTIARVATDGRLLVGPDSAGADPGPACYLKGGSLPTITDADLVLGMLDPNYYLGGRMQINAEAARTAINEHVATALGLSVEDAATAMVRINDVHMADAIKVFAAQKGVDLASSTLVPCGGAGPLHAVGVAEELGVSKVLVPTHPGGFSAVGLLSTDVVQDFVQSQITPLGNGRHADIVKRFADLESRATADLTAQGFTESEIVCHREVDARYTGQGFELRLPADDITADRTSEVLTERFHDRHMRTYGHIAEGELVEIVSYRVRAVVDMPKYTPSAPQDATATGADTGHAAARPVYSGGQWHDAMVVRRDTITTTTSMPGPVIVEQPDTTTFVPPGWRLTRDRLANLIVEKG